VFYPSVKLRHIKMDNHRDVDNYGFHFNKYSKNKIVLDPKNKQDKG
jgi:hypothetical protein